MKITYYKAADGYAAVTSESPKGFKGILFIGKSGTLDKIVETAFEANQLRKMTKVAKADVPPEWVEAFGYEEPDPEPEPPVEPPPVEIDVTWWPFTPPAAPKKMTPAEKRQADLIALAIALVFVVIAYLRM